MGRSEPRRIGRYELGELLGRGGMAEVWRARVVGPEGFNRTVALKRPLPELMGEPEFRRMFVAEARILAQLHHPGVVGVFDFGEADGVPFLVMELIEGWTLARLVRARRALDPGCAAFVALELCRGLGYVHRANGDDGRRLELVHRDLSPSNIMIGNDGSVRLLDFGTAKALNAIGDERTRTGVIKGKLPYMSPEQAAGGAVDPRSDQFSLGAVLYEMLTGTRLFDGDADAVVLRQVREAPIDPPSRAAPGVPEPLDEVCLRLLSRDPARRFPSCDEAAATLAPVVARLGWGPLQVAALVEELRAREDAVVPLPRTGRLDRAGEQRRRRAWWLAGAALVVVAGLATAWRVRARSAATTSRAVVASPSPSPSGAVVSPPSPTPPSLPVRLVIESRPAGAQVLAAGNAVPLGRTPLSLPLPRGRTSLRFVLRLPDRAPVTLDVVPDADQHVSIDLPPSSPRARRPAARAPDEEKQLERAIKKGKLVDPFD